MAKRRSVSSGYWLAGLGWGVAAGVALGALVLAPHLPTDGSAPSEEAAETSVDSLSPEEKQNIAIDRAHAAVSNEAVGDLIPAALAGRLDQRPVLVISTADAQAQDVDAVRWLLGHASAVDAGQITVSEKLFSQDAADELKTIVTNSLPAGAQLSEDNLEPGTHAGEALGSALMLDPETSEPLASSEDRGVILQALRDAGMLDYSDGTILPAQVVILITGDNDGTGEGAFAAQNVANFARAMDGRGNGVVLAGLIQSAAEQGPLGLVRASGAEVTTVDSIDQEFARGATIVGVEQQLAGEYGAYGATAEADAALPEIR